MIDALCLILMNCFALATPSPVPCALASTCSLVSWAREEERRGWRRRRRRSGIQSTHPSASSRPARRTLSQDRNIDNMSAGHLIILPRAAVGKITHAGGIKGGCVRVHASVRAACAAKKRSWRLRSSSPPAHKLVLLSSAPSCEA